MAARKRAGDLTGLETERLVKENQAELKLRAQEIAMMAEIENEQNDIPVDYSEGPVEPPVVEELYVAEVKLESPTKVIIPNTTLEKMTFGAGKHYDFEEGKKYTVPIELARHLESKGLLYTGAYR
jgi:hypothetical protein